MQAGFLSGKFPVCSHQHVAASFNGSDGPNPDVHSEPNSSATAGAGVSPASLWRWILASLSCSFVVIGRPMQPAGALFRTLAPDEPDGAAAPAVLVPGVDSVLSPLPVPVC